MLKYTNKEIQNIIKPYQLIEYKGVKEIYANDDEGYKYKLTLANLQDNKVPSRWMKNPFSTENILLYLSINHPDYEWIDNEKYKGCKYKHQFICHKHKDKGIQYNSFDNIINNNHVCKYCGYETLGQIKRLDESKIIELCNEKDLIYCGRYSKNHESWIQYKCPKHIDGKIQEMSLTHFKESVIPCRFCNTTAGELKILKYLDSQDIKYKVQKAFNDCKNKRALRFDFYLMDKNICIEYDGQQHFYPVNFNGSKDGGLSDFQEIQKRDKIKNIYCNEHNIKLIRIPYWDYDNIEKILQCKI